jgi:hypothetical protein
VEIAALVLEYLKVVVSWPVAVIIIGLIFMSRFKLPLTALIDRVAAIRIPGGAELLTPQAAMNVLDASRSPASAPALAAEVGHEAGPDREERAESERRRATLWEYRFLNYFLVPRTQIVLDWLNGRGPTGVAEYDAWMLPLVPNPVERFAVIDALRNHHLVDISANHMISVTPKGKEYIQWRGPAERFLASTLAASPPAALPSSGEPGPVAPPP